MRQFKLLTWGVSGLNNKVFGLDDIVSEGHFSPGHADELVSQGFLTEIKPKVEEPLKSTAPLEDDPKGEENKNPKSSKKK